MSDIPPELAGQLSPEQQAQLAALAGSADTSPPVYFGRRQRTRPIRGGGEQPIGSYDPDIRSMDEAVLDIYTWDDAELRSFQERAFNAGLFGTDDRSRVRFGDRDSSTFSIWKDMVERSAGFYAVDKNVTPWEALEEAERADRGVSAGDGRAPLSVQLDNPESLKRLLREAATEALGSGNIDDAKLDGIVQRWHSQQQNEQASSYATAESGGTVTEGMDIETFADRELRRIDPTAYDANKVIGGLREAFDFLGGE